MVVNVYSFPKLESDCAREVEDTVCRMINAYRNGAKIEPEVLDWMDFANTWLETIH